MELQLHKVTRRHLQPKWILQNKIQKTVECKLWIYIIILPHSTVQQKTTDTTQTTKHRHNRKTRQTTHKYLNIICQVNYDHFGYKFADTGILGSKNILTYNRQTFCNKSSHNEHKLSKTLNQPSSMLLTWMACFSSSMCCLSAVMYSIGVTGSVSFTGNLRTSRLHKQSNIDADPLIAKYGMQI